MCSLEGSSIYLVGIGEEDEQRNDEMAGKKLKT